MRTLIVAGWIIALTIARGHAQSLPSCGQQRDGECCWELDTIVCSWPRVPARTGDAQCPGDFNGDGTVSINELITAVNSSLLGCPTPGPRFTDNGDGTITDTQTRLMWEKKDQSGGIHDWGNVYTWCANVSPMDGACDNGPDAMDGTIVTTFLAALNGGGGFAGHTDWRIPSADELESIRNLDDANPATYSAFNTGCAASCTVTMCSCTAFASSSASASGLYWSSTTSQHTPDGVGGWVVNFDFGDLVTFTKTSGLYARAVRNAP
jgi:hypothetical protein